MGNWFEKLRQIQGESMDRQNRLRQQQAQRARDAEEQERQAVLQRNEELRRQKEKGAKYWELLDAEKVASSLEEMRSGVWQGRGNVSDEVDGTRRRVKLLFKQPVRLPEVEHKSWTSKEKEYYSYESQGGSHHEQWRYPQRESSKVVKWHRAVWPTQLVVGIDTNILSAYDFHNTTRNFEAMLYVVDSDVNLSNFQLDSFWDLLRKADNLGTKIGSTSSTEHFHYENESGGIFNKQARSMRGGSSFFSASSFYLIEMPFEMNSGGGMALGLNPDTDKGLIGEFLNYAFASSVVLRQEKGRFPFQQV